jgi:6-phosphogluconolactonase
VQGAPFYRSRLKRVGGRIALYVIGASKKEMVKQVFNDQLQPDFFPVQNVGTSQHKALWILDSQASSLLFNAG